MSNKFNREEVVLFEKSFENFEKSLEMSLKADKLTTNATTMQRTADEIWLPVPIIAGATSGLDATGQSADYIELAVPGRTDQIRNSLWTLNAKALRDPHYAEKQGIAAGQKLAAEVEIAIGSMLKVNAGQMVKRGTATGYDDLAECDTRLTEIGVQSLSRNMFMNARDNQKIAANLAGRQTVDGKVQTALERNYLGRYAGFETYREDIMPRLQAAGGGATAVAGANQVLTPAATSTASTGETSNVDNRYQYLVVDNTAGCAVGDRFTIPSVYSVHLITKEQTNQLFTNSIIEVVNGTTLKVLAMIDSGVYQNVSAAPADGASLTWLNTVAAPINVFWESDSVMVLPGSLAFDQFKESMAVMEATTDNGIKMVMMRQADIFTAEQTYRFTINFGVLNRDPLKNGIMLFDQT
jgi:hypothetical protein